ncbi:hypothetical protein GCM10009617_17540 [Leifsonia poae]|uniref:Uncharacterized protein n=1 Tax=Leifsonia poae TaxID=110933 RepID=A0A9W6HCX3_9MICO|nr:hypothetical protein GCM10017584_33290 [Leifsonia poae]
MDCEQFEHSGIQIEWEGIDVDPIGLRTGGTQDAAGRESATRGILSVVRYPMVPIGTILPFSTL